jgi:cbb3-type cytochrome oxidase maturation protein
MNILLILIPAASLVVLIFIAFFIWNAHTGQYDDLDGEAMRILNSDDSVKKVNLSLNDIKKEKR